MGTTGKQGLNKPPQPAMRKDGVPVNVTPLRDDPIAATQAFFRQKVHEKRSYLKAAFANPYNLTLLAGGLVDQAQDRVVGDTYLGITRCRICVELTRLAVDGGGASPCPACLRL